MVRFQDLQFTDEAGKPMPTVRPATIYGIAPVSGVRSSNGTAGNVWDLYLTLRWPNPPQLGAGLDKQWSILHPLLSRPSRTWDY